MDIYLKVPREIDVFMHKLSKAFSKDNESKEGKVLIVKKNHA